MVKCANDAPPSHTLAQKQTQNILSQVNAKEKKIIMQHVLVLFISLKGGEEKIRQNEKGQKNQAQSLGKLILTGKSFFTARFADLKNKKKKKERERERRKKQRKRKKWQFWKCL